MNSRVGIFGGSFDPVHSGHVKAAESFLRSRLIDELLVLLTPHPPHKSQDSQVSYEHRLQMLKIAFRNYDNVTVSDLESTLPKPSYTLQTILYLKEKNPSTKFYLCIGEDGIRDFQKWYKYREILNLVPLLVAERPGYDSSGIPGHILECAVFADHEPVGISSTEIRTSGSHNEIPEEVKQYIKKHNLYK